MCTLDFIIVIRFCKLFYECDNNIFLFLKVIYEVRMRFDIAYLNQKDFKGKRRIHWKTVTFISLFVALYNLIAFHRRQKRFYFDFDS